MILFSGPPGRVIAMRDPGIAGVLPAGFIKPDPSILFAEQKAIITRVMVAKASSYQFLHTLGGDIYIYVFGERIGQMMLSGMAFSYDCDNDDGDHGVEKMLDWYDTNRLSARETPVTILLGRRTTLTAFVGEFSADVVDPSSRIMQWNMNLILIPEKAVAASGGAAGAAGAAGESAASSSTSAGSDSGD